MNVYRLYLGHPGQQDWTAIALTPTSQCKTNKPVELRALAGGRLAYLDLCGTKLDPLPSDNVKYLNVYDPVSRSEQRLLAYQLPEFSHAFDLAPDMNSGIFVSDGYVGGSIYWLTRDKATEITNLPIAIPGSPSISRDGTSIAFDAVVDSHGREGIDALDLPRTLFRMKSDGSEIRKLTDGFVDTTPVDWSPDGRWLVATIQYSLRPGDGATVLINAETGNKYSLLSIDEYGYGRVVWSPDGRSLAKIASSGGNENWHQRVPDGVYIFDVSNIDQLVASAGG